MSLLPLLDEAVPIAPPRKTAATIAWVLVFLDGLLLACGSVYWLARGRFFDERLYEAIAGAPWEALSATFPAVDRVTSAAVRLSGVLGLCASLLLMVIAVTGFRRGERWAWYATWALPFACSLDIATLAGYDALTATAAVWDLVLLSVALAALIAPYRRFFVEPQPTGVLT